MEEPLQQVVILGAGKTKSLLKNPSLVSVGVKQCALDWLLSAFEGKQARYFFVGGYQCDAIAKKFPHLRLILNPQWEQTGCDASLRLAPLDVHLPAFICYGDILLRSALVEQMAQWAMDATVDGVVAVDSDRSLLATKSDYERVLAQEAIIDGAQGTPMFLSEAMPRAKTEAAYPFIGCVYLEPNALQILYENRCFCEPNQSHRLSDVMRHLAGCGLRLRLVDGHGRWAEVQQALDVARFVLTTKAQTLQALHKRVTKARILEQVHFSVQEWRSDSDNIVRRILATFGEKTLVVRSSSLQEDSFVKANAGKFESVTRVLPQADAIRDAVNRVIHSYGTIQAADQVLVQPMLEQVAFSGVVFTRSLHYGAPYYIVNYDPMDTEAVTSGASQCDEIFYHWKGSPIPSKAPWFYPQLHAALQEIEQLTQFDLLDVEFAVTDDRALYVFQVRPLTAHRLRELSDAHLQSHLDAAAERFVALQTPPPDVQGTRTLFGVMPDWNPAEIIGTKPNRLAVSLYQTLITNDIWAQQRAEFGYKDVRPYPLIVNFVGHPYVDVRASVHSFLPAALDASMTGRLVDFFIERLRQHPEWHDKLEFKVMPTCYTSDFDERWRDLLTKEAQLTPSEYAMYRSALQAITLAAVGKCAACYEEMAAIEARFNRIDASPLDPLDKMYVLLQTCKVGTLNFSHLARCGFIVSSLLKAFVAKGILSEEEQAALMGSVQTITGQFFETVQAAMSGAIPKEACIATYGHLRPGTYDITSPTYRSDPEKYLFAGSMQSERKVQAKPIYSDRLKTTLQQEFGWSRDVFQQFLRQAIAGREYSKFIFTRYLSRALDLVQTIGEAHGFSAQQMAHVPISVFDAMRVGIYTPKTIHAVLRAAIQSGERDERVMQSIELPPLICEVSDFYGFFVPKTLPNFIGHQTLEAPLIYLQRSAQINGADLQGKIVLIEQADPGFDWIFNYGIVGLITAYGGPNSHMAIRAAEFHLPAAIGIGEALLNTLKSAALVQLDCVGHRLTRMR